MRPSRILDRNVYKAPKRGKRAAVLLLDFFMTVIAAFVFFAGVFRPIYDNLPSTRNLWEEYSRQGELLLSMVAETGLQQEKDGTLVPLSTTGEDYARLLLQTSYYLHGMPYQEKDDAGKLTTVTLTEDKTLVDMESDGLATYYLQFRPENGLAGEKEATRAYLNEEILGLGTTNADLVEATFSMDGVFCLSREKAETLYRYLVLEENNASGRDLETRIVQLYVDAAQKGIAEVEEKYVPYKEALDALTTSYQGWIRGYEGFLVLSYVLGFLFIYGLFPLLFHNGRTLSYRFFSLARADRNPQPIPAWKYLVHGIVTMATHFWALFFPPLFLGNIDILSSPLVGAFTLFHFLFFSFLLALLSFVFCLVREDQQTLGEFIASIYTIDTGRHEEGSVFDNGKQ